jgi:hypothetical protein
MHQGRRDSLPKAPCGAALPGSSAVPAKGWRNTCCVHSAVIISLQGSDTRNAVLPSDRGASIVCDNQLDNHN